MGQILKNRKLLIFILALTTTFSISMNIANGSFMLDGNNFKWTLVFGILCVLFSKSTENIEKRLLICSRNI